MLNQYQIRTTKMLVSIVQRTDVDVGGIVCNLKSISYNLKFQHKNEEGAQTRYAHSFPFFKLVRDPLAYIQIGLVPRAPCPFIRSMVGPASPSIVHSQQVSIGSRSLVKWFIRRV